MGEEKTESPPSNLPTNNRAGKHKNLSVIDDGFSDGCHLFESTFREFMRLNAIALPRSMKPRWCINFYRPRHNNISWLHIFALPMFPDAKGDLTYAKIVVVRCRDLTQENMDDIITYSLTAKTRALSNSSQVRDIDIIVIADRYGKNDNVRFLHKTRKAAMDQSSRGGMAFVSWRGQEWIEKSIMQTIGKWLTVSSERLMERAAAKRVELYGELLTSYQVVSDLGRYLTLEGAKIYVPAPRARAPPIPTSGDIVPEPNPGDNENKGGDKMQKKDELTDEEYKAFAEKAFGKKIDGELAESDKAYVRAYVKRVRRGKAKADEHPQT